MSEEKMRRALEFMADPDNWAGDPTDVDAELTGDQTPFELACEALADYDEEDDAN